MTSGFPKGRWALPLFSLVLVGFVSACDEKVVEAEPVIRPVKAIQVDEAPSFQQRWFAGRAKATQEVDLSFRVNGTLVELPVNVGDEIAEGDLVAALDPATFQAEVDQAKANVARTSATLDNATLQRERDKTLYDKGHVAKARLDQSVALEGEAIADLNAAKASLERASLDLNYTSLKAPFDGVITTTFVDNFQDVQAKEPIVRLLDSSRIEMVVDIPENLISLAPYVTDVVVEFDPYPGRMIDAEIKEIGTEASATTRTYPITLIMDPPDDVQILPGMAGKASGKGEPPPELQAGSGLTVPVSATFSPGDSDGTFVWVVDEATKKVKRRQVEVGPVTATGISITEGVEPGDWVVTAGVSYLRDDQEVRLLDE